MGALFKTCQASRKCSEQEEKLVINRILLCYVLHGKVNLVPAFTQQKGLFSNRGTISLHSNKMYCICDV